MLAEIDQASVVPIVIALIGGGGLAGAIVAFLKLKPEANSAAVSQAQGAMEMMERLNKELKEELDRANLDKDRLGGTVREQEELLIQLRQMIRGMAMMEEYPPRPRRHPKPTD